jgi:hypothetical protein
MTEPIPDEAHAAKDGSALRFALYQLGGTEREARRAHAVALIDASGGLLVGEHVDHCDRRTAFKQRPAVRALINAIELPADERGFDAVMLPDPVTALNPGPYGLIPAMLTHYGIPLWTPAVAGPVDSDSELHYRLLINAAHPACPGCGRR